MKNIRNIASLLALAALTVGCEEPPGPGDWDFVSRGGTSFLGMLMVAVLAAFTIHRLFIHRFNTAQ